MGKRFLMLEHRGRKSGKTRQTVLEVVSNQDHAVYIAAAWGSKADWLRNVRANPHVAVLLGNATFETNAVELGETRARAVLVEYGDRHPKAFDKLAHFMLEEPGESTGEQVDRVAAAIPIVELPKPV